jgi:2-methylcitrate dehydratase PrpD
MRRFLAWRSPGKTEYIEDGKNVEAWLELEKGGDFVSTLAQQLAEFACSARYDDFPDDVSDLAKRCLFDTMGAIIAGSFHSTTGRIAREIAAEHREEETATVAGPLMKRSASTAALANGMMAHALELDDGSKHATYHPGSSIVPTCLALGEETGCSGKSMLEAIVAGYEVSLRIGTAVNPSHYLRGFHPTGTVAVFGTAAAAGKLLGLNPVEMTSALGIAGSMAAGINQYELDGSIVKHLHPGNAAKNGILAARLARKGFTGPEGVIEGRLGFCHCFADEYDLEIIARGLGKDFEFLKIYFKPFCSCRYVHFGIEAVQNILGEHPLKPEDIDRITIRTHKNAKQGSDIPDYRSVLHARLSLQYGIGSLIVRGSAGLKDYTEEAIKDERVREIARKITIEVDPEIQKVYPNPRSMIVEITDAKGNRYSSRVDHAKGSPENPMTEKELRAKFDDITGDVIDSKRRDEIAKAAAGAQNAERASDIAELLSFEPKM